MELTQSYLKLILNYDPDTGIFTWRHRPDSHFTSSRAAKSCNSRWAGTIAGYKMGLGYILLGVDGKRFYAHRLAFLYMTGKFPKEIDHANGIKSDNRWINLAEASHQENMRNRKVSKNNNSGLHGVSYSNRDGVWRAVIGSFRSGTLVHCGSFGDKFDAICARKSAELRFGYHDNHGRA